MKLDDNNRLWKDGISFTSFNSQTTDYALSKLSKVEAFSISDLFSLYKDILWDDGNHKYNVSSFLGELGFVDKA